jgi:DNA-binding NarL/FixJ family response regulator
MDRRLQRMERLLAEQVREHPEAAVRRVAEAEGLPEPPAGWGQVGQPWGELPERQAAMLQLWTDGATPSEIAAALGMPESAVERQLQQIRNQTRPRLALAR